MQRHQGFTVCQICQRRIPRPVVVTYGLIFCREHKREFKHRQHGGVSTDELNPSWGDTLRNWHERPPELDKEAKPRFLLTPFILRKKDEDWLFFERAYFQISLPRRSKRSITIRNPRKDFWRRFRRQKSSPPLHRLSDYLVVNRRTGEVHRFVDTTLQEVLDDVQEIRPVLAQTELAEFWGKRRPSGIREKMLLERSKARHQIE